jgi:16S rRNA (cytosine967-C5)-methyltransferase
MTASSPHHPPAATSSARRPLAGSLASALLAAAGALAAVRAGRSLAALPQAPADIRPQVQDLVYGSLRRYGWGDFILARLLKSPLADAEVHCLLQAAIYRLETRPEASHAIVHQAVEAAATRAGGRYRGLANAVLRNFLRQREALLAAAAADPEAGSWHPRWWGEALRQAYPAEAAAILAAGNAPPPMTLRVNQRRVSRDEYLARLAEAGCPGLAVGPVAIRLLQPVPVDRLPGFAEGLVSVQDAGAQEAARLLDPLPGQRVLDACAAPGGKSGHLLELADIDLLALDLDGPRCQRISDNLRRLRLKAEVACGDASRPADWWDGRPFDRILADVPCTASGVVRRHPDTKWLRRPDDAAGFAATQAAIVDALWTTLAPGGRLLYATCSLFPEENGAQVRAFLGRHADARPLPIGWAPAASGWQLLPDADRDGFFYALLEKQA